MVFVSGSGQRTKESFEEIIRKTDEFINAAEKMPEGFDKEQKIWKKTGADGTDRVTKAVIGSMRKAQSERIINISSAAAPIPIPL